MERLTQKDSQGRWMYASQHIECKCEYNDEGEIVDMYEEPYWITQYGPAIDRLAYYEDMFYTTLNEVKASSIINQTRCAVPTKFTRDNDEGAEIDIDLTLDILKAIKHRLKNSL